MMFDAHTEQNAPQSNPRFSIIVSRADCTAIEEIYLFRLVSFPPPFRLVTFDYCTISMTPRRELFNREV